MSTSTIVPPTSPQTPLAKRTKILHNTNTDEAPNQSTMSSSVPSLLIKKLSANAKLPTRGSAFAAGYDIYASKATTIPAQGKALVDTDIAMAVPDGTCEFALLQW